MPEKQADPIDPAASSEAVARRMRNTSRQDTPPELALRSILHREGLRFRVQRPIEGAGRARPDLVFVSSRVAVFVDGCFWHRCPQHGSDPKANAEWWRDKLDRNVERDRRTDAALKALGWRVVRVWEHEDPDVAARRVMRAVRGSRPV